ncbi:MAG: DUF2846 domain-containing protein [Pseudomonadales bacterium]
MFRIQGLASVLAAVCLTVFLSSCNSAPTVKSDFQAFQPTNPNNAVVYLYRPKSPWNIKSGEYPMALIDDKEVGTIKYEQHRVLELAPGRYNLRMTGANPEAKWTLRELEANVSLKAGQTYYFRIAVSRNTDAENITSPTVYVVFMQPVSIKDGAHEVSTTRLADS